MKKQDITISQSNLLTKARYNFTKIEKRALYFIIQEVRRQFIDKVDGQKDLFNDLVIKMDTSKLKGTDTQLREIYKSMKSLRRKSIWLEDDEQVLEVGYINYFHHLKRSGTLEVQVSNKILPYLVQLAEQFTTYSLTVAIALKTKYSQRFYEYCSQFRSTGFMYITIDELRQQMMLEGKYIMYAKFRQNVIDSAQKELEELYKNDECDLYFKYTEDRTGRSVRGLRITVITKKNEEAAKDNLRPEDKMHYIRTWLGSWLNAKKRPKNQEWINMVMKHQQKYAENIDLLYDRLMRMQKKNAKESYGAFARHIIEEDFLNNEPKQVTLEEGITQAEKENKELTSEEEQQAIKELNKNLKG